MPTGSCSPGPSTSRFIAPSDSDRERRSAGFARRCCVCPCPSCGHFAMPCGGESSTSWLTAWPWRGGFRWGVTARGWNVRAPRSWNRAWGSPERTNRHRRFGLSPLVSLTTGVLWSWRLGTSKTGERRYLIDLLETLPQAVLKSVLLVCDAGYVGYDLFALLLQQECSFLIRLSSQAQLYSLETVEVQGFAEGEFWYWTDDAEKKSKPALRVRVIRVAARKRKNDVWLVTNVLDPKRLPAELAARFYRMRWESECFFRTYKRVVKDVRLVSRTIPMVVREAEISLLACQLLLGQGALALKVGGKRAGRDELKCSAAEVLREIRRELDAARKPVPRSSFAKRLQQTGRERRERTGPKMKREPPRRKKQVAPQPPRLKVLSAEQKRQIEDSNLKEVAA